MRLGLSLRPALAQRQTSIAKTGQLVPSLTHLFVLLLGHKGNPFPQSVWGLKTGQVPRGQS